MERRVLTSPLDEICPSPTKSPYFYPGVGDGCFFLLGGPFPSIHPFSSSGGLFQTNACFSITVEIDRLLTKSLICPENLWRKSLAGVGFSFISPVKLGDSKPFSDLTSTIQGFPFPL